MKDIKKARAKYPTLRLKKPEVFARTGIQTGNRLFVFNSLGALQQETADVGGGSGGSSNIGADLMPTWQDLTPTTAVFTPSDFNHPGSVEAQLAGVRVIDVSAVPGFAHKYLMVWSSDHESVTLQTGIWMAGSNDLLTWIPLNSGNRVIASIEYPDPVVVGNELYILGHKYNGGSPNVQATFWTKSSNGISFGAQTELITPPFSGGHTGYTETWFESGTWYCKSLFTGGDYSSQAGWTAASIEGPWTRTNLYYGWQYHLDAQGVKQSAGGARGWNRGGKRFQFSSASTWAGTSGTGGAVRRNYQILVSDTGKDVVFPPRETLEPSVRAGHWNSGSFDITRPIRHTDGALYGVYVADDGTTANRGIGLVKANETVEAPAISDFPGTSVNIYDSTGIVQVGSEYAVLNAASGLVEIPSVAANGTFTYDSGTGLYTMTGTAVGSTYAIGWDGLEAPDFANDAEVSLEIVGLLHPYLIADIFWTMSLYAVGSQAGARLGWFSGSNENWLLRTYGTSPATTDTLTTHDRSGDGMSLIRANVRQKFKLSIRPSLGHVWVTLDDHSSIIALSPSAAVMGRTGTGIQQSITMIPRVASRTLTFSDLILTRRR